MQHLRLYQPKFVYIKKNYAICDAAISFMTQQLKHACVRPGVSEHGIGLIAIRPIVKNQRICSSSAHMKKVKKQDVKRLHPAIQKLVCDICDSPEEGEDCYIPSDYELCLSLSMFLNHSSEPSAYLKKSIVHANRDIAVGEEITVDYREYLDEGSYLHGWATRLES